MASFNWIATALGHLVIARVLYGAVGFLRLHLVKPDRPLSQYRRAGRPVYALITGASAGIGLGIAQALVRAGFNLILLGHLDWELDEAAAGLRAIRPGVDIKTLVVNARTATPAEIEQAVASISGLDVSVVVNNVGGNHIALPTIRTFGSYSIADVDGLIDQNARFMARLTHMMLPVLARGTTQGQRSLVISMSSMSIVGSPWFVMYSATKAFNAVFSVALGRELQAEPATRHVGTLAVVPGDVRSQSNKFSDTDGAPRWDAFGQSIVNKAEYAAARSIRVISPYWFHDLQYRFFDLLPEWVGTKAVTDLMATKKEHFTRQEKTE